MQIDIWRHRWWMFRGLFVFEGLIRQLHLHPCFRLVHFECRGREKIRSVVQSMRMKLMIQRSVKLTTHNTGMKMKFIHENVMGRTYNYTNVPNTRSS